jgi:predicted RNA binding protein YcfA (HicA-like mRNA interferase family)
MTQLPVVSGKQCIQALEKAGFAVVRQRGSHVALRRETPPPGRTVVVPDHRELDRGTLRAIIRQADLTVEMFVTLL